MGIEIEKKYLIKELPENLESYKCKKIEQGYLNQKPVVRIRRSDDDYYLTYKGKGLMEREEYNLPLTKEAYQHLSEKVDGNVIIKSRYVIPFKIRREDFAELSDENFAKLTDAVDELNIELDIFEYPKDLILAEIEFPSTEAAMAFTMPYWFKEEVTENPQYHNVNMIWGEA